jgi:hypothetical protein
VIVISFDGALLLPHWKWCEDDIFSENRMDDTLDSLLTRLEQTKHRFDADSATVVGDLLTTISGFQFDDAVSLIRFHEALLFLRAYPQSSRVLSLVERNLRSFHTRVSLLRESGADMTPFDYIENSGIAGTTLSGTWSYGIVSFLTRRHTGSVEIDWDRFEKKSRLGNTLSRFVPLMDEDSLVEANIPYLTWLRSARGRRSDLEWLINGFDGLQVSEREKAEIYELLELPIRWGLAATPASRTRCKSAVRKVYYHTGQLIRRSDVSLDHEFASSPPSMTKLSRAEGQCAIDMLREVTAVRYRELYGITYGDPAQVVRFELGRGLQILLWGLPAFRRLPLRAYHAGFTLKNGVPINYIEGISLFDRMELGFNMFYTFRDGESAWVYANVLRALNRVAGVTCFSIDPYQLGFNNDEPIESGAFWFYRKLGFRPVRRDIAALVAREEKKIAADRAYRTSTRTLRRLSVAPAIYEVPGSSKGDWDRFRIRNVGLAVARWMSRTFDGDLGRIRRESAHTVLRWLGIRDSDLKDRERRFFEHLSLVLAAIPDRGSWSAQERSAILDIIRAKAGTDERKYLSLLRQHLRFRRSVIGLGSSTDKE